MDYRIIAEFKHKNKNYYIVQTEKNIINYAIIEDGDVITRPNKEDFELFSFIHESLKVDSDNSIKLGITNIDQNDFQIYYDLKTKLYYWFKLENDELIEATYEENSKLNYKYNNNSLVLNSNEKTNENENKNNKTIKRIIRRGKDIFLVTVMAGLSFTLFSQCKANNILEVDSSDRIIVKEEFLEDFIEIPEGMKDIIITNREGRYDRPYNYDEIRNALQENESISEEEKKFLEKLKFVFDENHEYMDMNEITRRIKSLKISYIKDSDKYDGGSYNIENNEIKIYNAEDFKKCDIGVFIHEFCHVLQAYTNTDHRFNLELSNELFTREVVRRLFDMNVLDDKDQCKNEFGEYTQFGSRGYGQYMYIEYYMAELLTKEQMKDYQFWPDENVLVSALLEIDGMDKERIDEILRNKKSPNMNQIEQEKVGKVYKLLGTIDSLREYNKDRNAYYPNVTIGEYIKAYCDIYNQMDYYYMRKYGKSMGKKIETGLQDIDRYNDIKLGNYYIDDTFRFIDEGWMKVNFISKGEIPEIFLSDHDEAFTDTIDELSDMRLQEKYDYLTQEWQMSIAKELYYLPRTYFSDDHPFGCIYLNPKEYEKSKVVIDEKTQEIFEDNYDRLTGRKKQEINKNDDER